VTHFTKFIATYRVEKDTVDRAQLAENPDFIEEDAPDR
jgi:hypothetical protein